jgi:hypothetical protein
MIVTLNGKEVCDSYAVYGGPGYEHVGTDGKVWTSMSKTKGCPDLIPVHKGDKLGITSYFDFEKHPS